MKYAIRDLYSSITRTQKKLLFVAFDLVALPLALWSSFSLRFGEPLSVTEVLKFWWMFVIIPIVGIILFARLGLYRAVVRFMGQQAVVAILKGVIILSMLLYVMAYLSAVEGFPRSVPINFALISGLYVSGSRFLVRSFYQIYINGISGKEPVLIYGAGDAGTQLAASLLNAREFNPVAFVDDDVSLHGHSIHGMRVYASSQIKSLIDKYGIVRVLMAVPSATKSQRKLILERLKSFPVHVQTLPTVAQLVTGVSPSEYLQEVELDDLLGRDVVPPNDILLNKSIEGKVVMVTGAGGSIGSELCRQILKLKPKLLVLYDNSEFALYSIEKELIKRASSQFNVAYELVAILGSVQDKLRVGNVIRQYGVQTIYHAAAYKHVPIVEHNILEGIRNNIFGTKEIAEAALRNAVERFVLISTDKAVRPTNVMGATKRGAEQVIQVLAERSQTTVFSMVRFGNVLGSSGSVVPLFRKQIEEGGPVTLTHRDVVRYFMSIPEAAQLVIQAGAMAHGGEVFVLDMGEPVKIYDLAKNMIQLSGLEVIDESNPDGDIEIEITGLRPGEKLYEELLIGENVEGTEHPLIMRANEEYLAQTELDEALNRLSQCIGDNDPAKARETLKDLVIDYHPVSGIVDHLKSCDKQQGVAGVQLH